MGVTNHSAHPRGVQRHGESSESSEDRSGDAGSSPVGAVIIGRNEGARLVRCIRSVLREGLPLVVVDSGSTDESVVRARSLGVDIVELDAGLPFTAARARNTGYRHLRQRMPSLALVQFLDGDTELVPGFIAHAVAALQSDTSVVAVCGRRRERALDASIYNRLCDLEWDTPVGEAAVFGGDVMVRASAFEAVGGYTEGLIAGEDPDLAVRLRCRGGRVLRVPQEMTLHDADMEAFSQWWTRAVRGGHAFAEGAHRHSALGVWRREVRSNWLFGAALPLAGIGLALPTAGASAVVVSLAWVALFLRVRRTARRRGLQREDANLLAAFTTLSKLPNAFGQARYWHARWRGRAASLIEYKAARGGAADAACAELHRG